MIYKVYFGKSKNKTPYTVGAMSGSVVTIGGLKNVKAFCGSKIKRLRPGTYWSMNNGIEYYIEREESHE